MADKQIKRTIVLDWDDKMSAAVKRAGAAVQDVVNKAKGLVTGQTAVNAVTAKAPSLYERMKAAAKSAYDTIRKGQREAQDGTKKMDTGMGQLGATIRNAFSAAVIINFVKQLVAAADEMDRIERSARQLANMAPGSVSFSGSSKFGKEFHKQAEIMERALGLEGGEAAKGLQGGIGKLLQEGALDPESKTLAKDLQDAMRGLLAAQRGLGGDPAQVAGAAAQLSKLTGESAFQSIERFLEIVEQSGEPINEVAAALENILERTEGLASVEEIMGAFGAGGVDTRKTRSAIEAVMLDEQAVKGGEQAQFTGDFIDKVVQALVKAGDVSEKAAIKLEESMRAATATGQQGGHAGVSSELLIKSGFSDELLTNLSRDFGDTMTSVGDRLANIWKDETTGFFEKLYETSVFRAFGEGGWISGTADDQGRLESESRQLNNQLLADIAGKIDHQTATQQAAIEETKRLTDILESGRLHGGEEEVIRGKIELLRPAVEGRRR